MAREDLKEIRGCNTDSCNFDGGRLPQFLQGSNSQTWSEVMMGMIS
jgi:hypothetical protein